MTDGMPKKLPLYVLVERSRHGKVMFYFRRGKGSRTRLPDKYPSKAFSEAYAKALAGAGTVSVPRAASPSDRLRWLVERCGQGACA